MHFGATEILIVLLIIVVLFGAKRIPELMRGLGRGVKEFKEGMREGEEPDKNKKPDDKNSTPIKP